MYHRLTLEQVGALEKFSTPIVLKRGESALMSPELQALISQAKAKYEAMTPEEKEAMHDAQRKSYVRAEMSWPKPRYKYINGVKVYESYSDYCNG